MLKTECNDDSSSQKCRKICQEVDTVDLESDGKDLVDFFLGLPLEMLYKIFEQCPLRDQLALAKCCKLFRQIIRDICEKKFRVFNYDYVTFKYSQQLQNDEISDLCYLCGRAVERMRFTTFFNIDLLKDIEASGKLTNPIENVKYFINDNFKQNVKYFKNLKELEIQGEFLQDHTVLELGKYCKELKALRFLDGDNRWLIGEFLKDLEGIEILELKFCRNLEPNHLLVVSQTRQVKSLNIMECERLKCIPTMIKLCKHWQNLQVLRLSAFTQDGSFLKAIINLPALKTLQFYWINFMPLNFEEHFFFELKLNQTKCLQLTQIKFENDRYYIEDESLQEFTPETYAVMRENVCINGQKWQWPSDVFEKISSNFVHFSNLHKIYFHYCRLLDYEQMKHLSLINTSLKYINVYGCPKREDELYKQRWLQEEALSNKCQLKFESFLSLEEVLNLHEEANSRQFSSYYRRGPVLRSIECQFR